MSDFEVGKPLDFANPGFDLPPVTEKSTGFITGEDDSAPGDSVPPDDDTGIGQISGADRQDSGASSGDPLDEWKAYRGQLSRKGVAFDPSVHQCPPSETKAGYWRKKSKAQRKAHGLEDDAGQPDEKAQAESGNANYRQQAQNLAWIYAQLHAPLYGEGAKTDPEELAGLVDAYEAYVQQKGGIPISPGWGALLGSAMYTQAIATRKSNMEKTREYMRGIGGIFRKLGEKLKIVKPKRKPQNEQKQEQEKGGDNARFNSGEFGQRENESGETTGVTGRAAQ